MSNFGIDDFEIRPISLGEWEERDGTYRIAVNKMDTIICAHNKVTGTYVKLFKGGDYMPGGFELAYTAEECLRLAHALRLAAKRISEMKGE